VAKIKSHFISIKFTQIKATRREEDVLTYRRAFRFAPKVYTPAQKLLKN